MKEKILLGVVLVGFTVFYFVGAGQVSEVLNVSFTEDLYEQKINAIESQAEVYAESQETIFSESNSIYVTVEELALNSAIISSEEGVVNDPRGNGTLNDLKVKITLSDGEVTAKVLS